MVRLTVLPLVVDGEDGVGIVQPPSPLAAGSTEVIRIGVLRPLVCSGGKLHKVMMEYSVVNIEVVRYGRTEQRCTGIDEQFVQPVCRER